MITADLKRFVLGFATATLLLGAPAAYAGVIVGGSTMLNTGSLATLEGWLGEGELTLTNIFTKNTLNPLKNDSGDWHAAVNGTGRTFTLWEVTTSNGTGGQDHFVYGGYNPQSWNSSTGWNMTSADAQRTAFIFNLTTAVKLDQCKTSDSPSCGWDADGNSLGAYQSYNHSSYGPAFGAGHDLYVNSTLSGGYDFAYSYGIPTGDVGCCHTSPLDLDNGQYGWVSVGALETFLIGSYTAVPEPASLALLGLGLAGLGFSRRKKA